MGLSCNYEEIVIGCMHAHNYYACLEWVKIVDILHIDGGGSLGTSVPSPDMAVRATARDLGCLSC